MSTKEPKFIKVLHMQAEGEMKTLQIKRSLNMFRALVGGHVAFAPLRMSKEEWKGWKHTAERLGVPHIKTPFVAVNEDGMPLGLPQNKFLPHLVGNIVLVDKKDRLC
tara:strand:- start:359 stop:679 length:321 start_codon:yes stop_codon:yes gene_type:complete